MPSAKNPAKLEEGQYIQQPIQTVDGHIRIKKYVKLKVVGSGSYSKCYLVKNMDSDSTYVAKIIPDKKLQILQKEKLFYEIKIHQSLSHPNVVHLDHWFKDDGNQYIFMEYCQNGNLEARLQEVEHMEEKEIRRYGEQIVQAIEYIHSQNILHRDLKLCNFYLDGGDNVKLGDFGFACQLASDYDRKRETCGTPNYIAPEAISGFGYSYSSDVWAIGVILYRLKYGRCPFEGENVKRTLENVKLCNYKFPSKPKISPELKDLIEKIFNLNYDERMTTQEILNHKFFQQDRQPKVSSPRAFLKQEKRGFSLSRLFSKEKKKEEPKLKSIDNSASRRQGIMERQIRNTGSKQKKEEPKRSNSCETFKQIKQIFKSKSKQTLVTASNIPTSKKDVLSPYYTLNTVASSAVTTREKEGVKTSRGNSFAESSLAYSLNQTLDLLGTSKKEETSSINSRINNFIKAQSSGQLTKEQLRHGKTGSPGEVYSIQAKQKQEQKYTGLGNAGSRGENPRSQNIGFVYSTHGQLNIGRNNKSGGSLAQQQLHNLTRRYYLPVAIQNEKDVVVVHYTPSVKQVLYNGCTYLMQNSNERLFRMGGEQVSIQELPKVLRYIVENKIQICENPVEELTLTTDQLIAKLPQACVAMPDGVIMRYGLYTSLLIAKLFIQEGYYVCEESGQPFMYSVSADQVPRLFEGIVIMRIYSGWVKTHNKKDH